MLAYKFTKGSVYAFDIEGRRAIFKVDNIAKNGLITYTYLDTSDRWAGDTYTNSMNWLLDTRPKVNIYRYSFKEYTKCLQD